MATTTPLLARLPDVRVHPPQDDGAPWLVQNGERYFRVGADAARLLDRLDGACSPAGLAEELGAPWTEERVREALKSFARFGLLADADGVGGASGESAHGTSSGGSVRRKSAGRSAPLSAGRLRFVPPMTFQFTLWNPDRLMDRLLPVTRALLSRRGLTVLLLLVIAGLMALTAQAQTVWQAVSTPPSPQTYLSVFTGVLLVTGVHEVGHGAVLAHYGQRPTRVGMMLYYLTPAFFCDVSDGWRLPRKEQRVAVALAGVGVQTVIGATAALAATVTSGQLRANLLIFAVVCYLYGVFNLLPLVKFDGYLALMSHVDIPNLRAKAMADARTATLIRVTGGDRPRKLPQVRWAVAYGLACQVFPLYLIGTGLTVVGGLIGGLPFGAVLLLLLVLTLAFQACKVLHRTVGEVRAAGGSVLRLAGVALTALAAVTVLLTQVTVDRQMPAGYATVHGRPVLVLPPGTDSSSVPVGAPVLLRTQGFLLGRTLGRTTLAPGAARTARVPLSAVIPVRADLKVPTTVRPLSQDAVLPAAAGAARVDLGRESLGSRLCDYLTSSLIH
jgi:putative peptide zinc metalloprotease protein